MGLTRATKPVRRAFDGLMRRGLVLTIYPNNTIGFRQLRARKEYLLPVATVFRWAVEADLEARKAERAKERQGGRILVKRGLL